MNLPTGTVTFLLTDIEGSTKLWELAPEAMREAVSRHNALGEEIFAREGGLLVKSRGEGDALFGVFGRASDAVAAACALQLAYFAEPWPGETPIRVRMAAHTGEAGFQDGDYYGAAVNRCARLRAIAHGGQILLSDVTRDLSCDSLPRGVSLKNLGEQRLRDLGRPETAFQVVHPDLPFSFPPLKSLDNPDLPNNLPQQVTSFVGREAEIAEIHGLIGRYRLVTLVGSGGAGKTRLSLQVAAELLESFNDGVWFTELAHLNDGALVSQAVASAIGVREKPSGSIIDAIVDDLKEKSLCLVLDNCEHLLDECAALSNRIIRSCPGVRIIATSREALGIPGETSYKVPSLSLPKPQQVLNAESIAQYEAVRLFADRATAVSSRFEISEENAGSIVQLCSRLDGIPLAIELAAARIRAMPVEQIAARLDDRFRLLTGGSRTNLPRQQTLRALVDWSYDLLRGSERALLRRLSVFSGGLTIEAAEAVCEGDPIERWEVLDLLTSLVDKSLVIYDDADGRYRLLETVRQYARERLFESGKADAVRTRHFQAFAELIAEAQRQSSGKEQARWARLLDADLDNVRSAIEWRLSKPNDPEIGLTLGCCLVWYWAVRGHYSEGRQVLEDMLKGPGAEARTVQRARALCGVAGLVETQGHHAQARSYFDEALSIYSELGDERGLASASNGLASVALQQTDYETAGALYRQSLDIAKRLNNESLMILVLGGLGEVAFYERDFEKARSWYEESLQVSERSGNRRAAAYLLGNIGNVAREQGDFASARNFRDRSLRMLHELGDRWAIAEALKDYAFLAVAERDFSRAACLLGAAEAMRELLRVQLPSSDVAKYEGAIGAARAQLGDESFIDGWSEGRRLTLESAIAFALETSVASPR